VTISEVSKKYGISQDTLRYYEKEGMIPPVNRDSSGNRVYTEEDLKWVNLSKCMRAAGFSVKALVRYVALYQQGDPTFDERLQLLLEEKERMLKKRDEINLALERLDLKLTRIYKFDI